MKLVEDPTTGCLLCLSVEVDTTSIFLAGGPFNAQWLAKGGASWSRFMTNFVSLVAANPEPVVGYVEKFYSGGPYEGTS